MANPKRSYPQARTAISAPCFQHPVRAEAKEAQKHLTDTKPIILRENSAFSKLHNAQFKGQNIEMRIQLTVQTPSKVLKEAQYLLYVFLTQSKAALTLVTICKDSDRASRNPIMSHYADKVSFRMILMENKRQVFRRVNLCKTF